MSGQNVQSGGQRDANGRFVPGHDGSARSNAGVTKHVAERRRMLAKLAPEIIAKLHEQALDGDVQAASVLLDRIMPKVKPTTLPVELPAMADRKQQAAVVETAVYAGDIPPDTGLELMTMIAKASEVGEIAELRARIESLLQERARR